jgi:hypothetical protein
MSALDAKALRAITTLDLEAVRAIGYLFHRDARQDSDGATHACKGKDRSLCGLSVHGDLTWSGEFRDLTCPTCCRKAARLLSQHANRVRRDGDRFNPSNKPGTCLYCGWKLRKEHDGSLGRWGRGFFCTGTCAEYFAHAAARNGYRFKPKAKGGQS